MFPSNTCNIGNDPIAFTHEQSLISHSKPYFLNETYNNIIINTISNPKQQFFYFPSSPLFEDESLFPHIHQNHHDLLLHNSPQPLFMRENNNFLSTSEKTHLLVSSTEPNINKSTINNNHKDPINLTNQHQPDDVSDLRKNHIRYDDDDRDDQRLQIPRKRMVVKKDRHSKIMMTTGKRPRHRRMRLSLEVARQFFDLQDMLGFERASKTVEWLLVQARSEIKKLAMESSTTSTITPTPTGAGGGVAKTANSNSNSGANSDCEVVSGLDEVAVNGDLSKPLAKEMKKRQLVSRPRGVFKRPRESRDKARERARERTKEKHMMKSQRALLGVVDHHDRLQYYDNQDLTISHGLSSWSMETGEEESATQSGQNNNNNSNNSLEAVVLQARSTTNHHHEFQEPLTSSWHNGQEQYRTTSTTAAANLVEECSFLNVGKYHWSPSSSIFNSPQNATTSGSSESIPQEHQFSHFQFFGNAWEACNNHKLC